MPTNHPLRAFSKIDSASPNRKTRLLLTGFEPFNGQRLNPSLEAARAMRDVQFAGAYLEVLELPVHRFEAIETTIDYLWMYQPDVIVMLGEAGGRFGLTLERVAINLDDFPIPDNGGHQPRGEKINVTGHERYQSTLPVAEIERRLVSAQIPASISDSAGTYLCNRLFYSVMHHLKANQSASSAGFIHLPYLEEQVSGMAVETPCFSRATLMSAVRTTIEVCLEQHENH